MVQYLVAAVIAVVTLVLFFGAGQQPEMAPQEYLRRNLGSSTTSLPWLLPLLYVLLALTLVLWVGHAALQPHPARPGVVRVHPRDRADRGRQRVLPDPRRRAPRIWSASAPRPRCWVRRWRSSPPGRCFPRWRTGSAGGANCG